MSGAGWTWEGVRVDSTDHLRSPGPPRSGNSGRQGKEGRGLRERAGEGGALPPHRTPGLGSGEGGGVACAERGFSPTSHTL